MSLKSGVAFYTYRTYQFILAIYEMLNSHMWLLIPYWTVGALDLVLVNEKRE